MASVSTGRVEPLHKGFAPFHKWDRNAFLALVGLIWVGILMGFGGDIVHHVQTHEAAYPLIVHFHAVAFLGWPTLLTAQVLLIRTNRREIHRKLGLAGLGLAAAMVVLGPATALTADALAFTRTGQAPTFLSIQFTDILAFTGLVAAGFQLRGDASAHKRLMLLAALYISDAGFARWLGDSVRHLTGDGYWPMIAQLYLANTALMLALGGYDLVTRRRLHPAYVAGLAWVFANELTAVAVFFNPAWTPISLKLIGH